MFLFLCCYFALMGSIISGIPIMLLVLSNLNYNLEMVSRSLSELTILKLTSMKALAPVFRVPLDLDLEALIMGH